MQKCTIPLELGAWRGPYHAHCPSRRRHRPFDRKGVSDRVDELWRVMGQTPGKTPLPLWGTLALQPGPRFQQIGDGDGGASPSPAKSGTDAPSPSPDKSGTGTGTGVSVP
jgi:hypothetical protein